MKKSKGKGEIVQVQGGHILRSTCRKDRHSKVYTSKGPRDRRVRLSANTAIQFYDVQDRLGYDRPSKAVDWLLKNAKHAIDMLAELPPWNTNPDTNTVSNAPAELGQGQNSSSGYPFLQHRQMVENTSFLNQTVGAQFVDDNTMKSFFPESRDLCLSLQTLQEMNSSHNYSRMVGWDGGSGGDGRVGSIFSNSESMTMGQPPTFCSMVSQRSPLQSSYTDLLRALDDRSLPSSHHHNQHAIHESSVSGSRFVSYFQVPARIHGQEEFMVVASDPITTSTSSLHSGH